MVYSYKYPRPSVTTDAIVIDNSLSQVKILLVQRKKKPYKDLWAFPGGFMNMDETLEECAPRELKEETGIDNVQLKQFKAYSTVDRDPRGRTISVVFYGFCNSNNVIPVADDDAKDAKWFLLPDLPKMAFDHLEILQDLISSLKI